MENGEPAKYDSNLTTQFQEMRENLSEKIESCASDMGYSLAPNIVLKTQETGMYILSQLSRGQFFHCINKYWKCQTRICIFSLTLEYQISVGYLHQSRHWDHFFIFVSSTFKKKI